jgi:hypothetical protein
MEHKLTWLALGDGWVTAEQIDGKPAFLVMRSMNGWLLTPHEGRRFDAFRSAEDAKGFADHFEDRPTPLR